MSDFNLKALQTAADNRIDAFNQYLDAVSPLSAEQVGRLREILYEVWEQGKEAGGRGSYSDSHVGENPYK